MLEKSVRRSECRWVKLQYPPSQPRLCLRASIPMLERLRVPMLYLPPSLAAHAFLLLLRAPRLTLLRYQLKREGVHTQVCGKSGQIGPRRHVPEIRGSSVLPSKKRRPPMRFLPLSLNMSSSPQLCVLSTQFLFGREDPSSFFDLKPIRSATSAMKLCE